MTGVTKKKTATILVVDDSQTVLRVVEAVLTEVDYHVHCVDNAEEALELAPKIRPDLIFVDFAMPQMNGYALCRELGNDEKINTVPIIMMTTRGDAVGESFIAELGIVDHISKPFPPEALLAVTEHTLKKNKIMRQRKSFFPSGAPQKTPAYIAAARVAEFLSEKIGDEEGRLTEKITTALLGVSPNDLFSVFADREGAPALAGDTRQIPVAEVFQLLALQRQSGFLHIDQSNTEVSIAFKDGEVRLVTGKNLPEHFLLGNILVQERFIDSDDLELLLHNRRGTRRRLGTQVVKLGMVTREQLHIALRRQSSELVYELLRRGKGYFRFEQVDALPAEVLEFEFGLTIDELLMEGFRRVDEWGLIESALPDFNQVVERVPGGLERIGESSLTAGESRALTFVNGDKTVSQLIRAIGGSSFEAARLLYRLISMHVLRIQDHFVAAPVKNIS